MPPSADKSAVLALLRAQRPEEAQALCEQVVRSQPDDAGLWGLLGAIYGMLNDPKQAERCAREALRRQPNYPEAFNNLGLALRLQGRNAEAIPPLREALRLKPDYIDAWYNLGTALAADKRFGEAVDCYRRVLASKPDDAEAMNDLGTALAEYGRPDEAIASYRRALDRQPAFLAAHQNLAKTLLDLGRHEEALSSCHATLQFYPDDPDTLVNLGVALEQRGEPGQAADAYRRAIAVKPDAAEAHFNLSLILLGQGRFREGWQEYAWHWKREGIGGRPFPPAAWDGANLDGRPVFLHGEQGLGDELFFLRFVPWLRQKEAGRIVYRAGPKIASILARLPGIDHVAGPEETPTPSDFVFSVGDLPRLLGMERAEQIPASVTLVPLAAELESMRARLAEAGPPPYLGVTWRAGIRHRMNVLYKESPLTLIAQALAPLKATVLLLQRHPEAGEIVAFASALGRPAHDLSAVNEDLEQMLALLSLLDEYVGVSNTNMHLRAAVGRTARVLVPAPPEWRWMAEGKESPWFPGFTVYRQGYDGDWTQALAQLESDLHDAGGHGRR